MLNSVIATEYGARYRVRDISIIFHERRPASNALANSNGNYSTVRANVGIGKGFVIRSVIGLNRDF